MRAYDLHAVNHRLRCHGWEGSGTKMFHDLHAVSLGLRCWFCGVSQALMSPVADETTRGQHWVLVRALLPSNWSVTDG